MMMSESRDRPLRLLAYSDSAIFSGAEAMFCEAVRGLNGRPSLAVRCAAPRGNPRMFEGLREASGGVDPIDVPAQSLPAAALHLYDPRRRAAVSRAIGGETPDVLLVNLPSVEYGGTPLLVGNHPRTVGFLHVAGSPRALGFRLGWIRERLARRVLGQLDDVCVVSPSVARNFPRQWDVNGAGVHAVRLPKPSIEAVDRNRARAELGLPSGMVVGIAGRISFKQKGHDTLVEAAELLAERGVDVSYAVAGDGRDRDRLERSLDARGLHDRFHLLGHVQPVELFLSALDAIVIPSRFEGLPLVALEALAVGVPGVVAATDGLQDVWPARWQVPAGNAARLATSLEELLESPPQVRDELIREGREAMDRCTGDDIAQQLAAVVEGTREGTG